MDTKYIKEVYNRLVRTKCFFFVFEIFRKKNINLINEEVS